MNSIKTFASKSSRSHRLWKKGIQLLKVLGPGIVTGAADDDPSGIATYSQTGAQFGYGMLWTAAYMLPFMMAVQEACARIGLVKGKGLAAVIKDHYPKPILVGAVILVLIANIVNIGADLGAMASAARLLLPLPTDLWLLIFSGLILALEVFLKYKSYSKILKWLVSALFAYPLTLFIVHQPWLTILKASFVPHFEFTFPFLFIITGVLGTTISPYLFFWEASQEVEEIDSKNRIYSQRLKITKEDIFKLRIDNTVGMLFSEIATWSIIVVAATVLHGTGIRNINTAADAAQALEPLVHTFPNAGFLAKLIFCIGILGLGFLAIPVLSGSAAYALSDALGWKASLDLEVKKAPGFYWIISLSTMMGLILNFLGVNPVKALIYTAVLNGVAAVPLIILIALISGSESIMKEFKGGLLSKTLLWITFLGMAAGAITMFFSI